MEKIVFLDRMSVKADFKSLSFPYKWIDYPMTQRGEVVDRLSQATIAITNKVPLRKNELKNLPDLRLVAVAATGTDCVDVNYCREKNITVSNVRNYALHSVPEHVFTLILALRRNLIAYDRSIKAAEWQKSEVFCLLDHPIRELHNSTLGIIGYGTLGQAVEKLALAFGMKVIIAEHKGQTKSRNGRTNFEEVLQTSDIISLHCPLTDTTRGLLGAKELGMMKQNTLLINCGRGGLVDETSLAMALKNRIIGGAGIDVLSVEPPGSGNIFPELDLPNLIITPHIAWASLEAMQILADQVIDNIESFIKGEPQNLV